MQIWQVKRLLLLKPNARLTHLCSVVSYWASISKDHLTHITIRCVFLLSLRGV